MTEYDRARQLATLRNGVVVWNLWRKEHPHITVDLAKFDLSGTDLMRANLAGANLAGADLSNANLKAADLTNANLTNAILINTNLTNAFLTNAILAGAILIRANLMRANLMRANLMRAGLSEAFLRGARLMHADLAGAILIRANLTDARLMHADLTGADLIDARLMHTDLTDADLTDADLTDADLTDADLTHANLTHANLTHADLVRANLTHAVCVKTNFLRARLINTAIYGISCWDVTIEHTTQQNLRITPQDQLSITVDNLKVAQFIYLMLNNDDIRDVIDTITSKAVLILGRFTEERKVVLDALRDKLREHNYLPIIFDFEQPENIPSYTQTVTLLARMARFIIADLTLPSSIPHELDAIVPTVIVPVQPLVAFEHEPYAMYKDFWPYQWVLPVHKYSSQEELLASITKNIITPAETLVKHLHEQYQPLYQAEASVDSQPSPDAS